MNTKMKTLSLAMFGLAGFAMAGSALATCPTGPDQASGGAWHSKSVTADTTLAITSPGLDSTSCMLSISVNAGALPNTHGYVSDNSPQNEQRYRARFYIDTAALTGLTVPNRQTKIFDAFATNSPTGVGTDMVNISLVGSSPATVRFRVADNNQASHYQTISVPLPDAGSPAGQYRIEFDLQQGTPGSFRYWVTDATTVTADGSPTGTATAPAMPYAAEGATGWSGVIQANLGVFTTSATFRTNVATQALGLDEFDSRRQTFIGL